jgi:hypothetical protein
LVADRVQPVSFHTLAGARIRCIACRVASIVSCYSILSNVDDVSFSDDGRFASVKGLYRDPKHRVDGDADVLPSGYVAEIRDADGALLVSQRFVRKDKEFAFSLQPTFATKSAKNRKSWSIRNRIGPNALGQRSQRVLATSCEGKWPQPSDF